MAREGTMHHLSQPYTDVADIDRDMEGLNDTEQRRFMQRLTKETHVSLHTHLLDEHDLKGRVEDLHAKLNVMGASLGKVDAALFHPLDGLVNMKKWMCRIATWTGIILGAVMSSLVAVASAGHSFGWW